MKRYREDERRALVGDFERSGLSAAVFCRQAGITAVRPRGVTAATGQGSCRAGFRRFPVGAGGGRQLDLQRRVGWRLVTGSEEREVWWGRARALTGKTLS